MRVPSLVSLKQSYLNFISIELKLLETFISAFVDLNQVFYFLAIAGADFVTVATDTRMSAGYSILSRTQSKTIKLTDKTILTSAGMVADVETLHKNLQFVIRQYEMQNKRSPSTAAIAQKLSTALYGRRFMPYYAFNLLCGIDDAGKGVIYGYDAVGSYDTVTYGA